MVRRLLIAFLVLIVGRSAAQYPFTRTFEIKAGQERPSISSLAQDGAGLLWVASDLGLMRTDGERTDLVFACTPAEISAMLGTPDGVVTALSTGYVVRCHGYDCDTILFDEHLALNPVRALAFDPKGRLWAGTYGAGIQLLDKDQRVQIDAEEGLLDDHVNDLVPLDNGFMAAATDQGVVVINDEGRIVQRINETNGAPDNLVLSLAVDEEGRVWAGTDRSGVFAFDALRPYNGCQVLDSSWVHGPVRRLVVRNGRAWAVTPLKGVVVVSTSGALATFVAPPESEHEIAGVRNILSTSDGAVWWCDGTANVHRSDPGMVIAATHEGVDLRGITALCADAFGSIWFATSAGVFHHSVQWADQQKLTVAGVNVSSVHSVVALHAAEDSSLWVGTFGDGAYRIAWNGSVKHYTEDEGLCNNNVLAISSRRGAAGVELWFATLAGVCRWTANDDPMFQHVAIPGAGFLYDILAVERGPVYAATDGSGLVRIDEDRSTHVLHPPGRRASTVYSVCIDPDRQIWCTGPNIGLAQVADTILISHAIGAVPFDGNVFSIHAFRGRIYALGSTGLSAFDPNDGSITDLSDATGLVKVQAELNTVCNDVEGALWMACDKGLVRFEPGQGPLRHLQPTMITRLAWGDLALPLDSGLQLRYDQNFLTFRFAAPYYTDPNAVRFEYRLVGLDNTVHTTRDREVNWPRLPPGQYSFEVRAAVGKEPASGEWTTFAFTIEPPWWRTQWSIWGGTFLLVVLLFVLIRGRDSRLRYRDKVEKEKTRFQLDALRSQVNPHFLFNSFNTLIELIEEDKDKATEHVEQLSEFFREILQVRDKELIPLHEEMRLVETYFQLERRRFGERIGMSTLWSNEDSLKLVPPLSVQLLVENALKHNSTSRSEPLVVEILVEDGMLVVRNPDRPREEKPRSTGFGINSIRSRYAALTEREVVVSRDHGLFTVMIPLIEPDHERSDS